MKKLLLHTCCGPCSTAVIEQLKDAYDITLYFYNPNICLPDEYQRRLEAQETVAAWANVPLIAAPYDPWPFLAFANDLEEEPEGGLRCSYCFALRLEETAARAKDQGFDCFTTTLSIGPTKNAELLNELGADWGKTFEITYLPANFKKQGGYQRSVELSKELALYRQSYCGCVLQSIDG
ncbi:MAG: epoxyqueuosine reductase QueH [Oscillospiraceae bacterium]|nr:epoxyqueuosine reductase QueH [Oscillospiraceae bacterium]